MTHEWLPSFVTKELDDLGMQIPQELLDRLARYLDLLLETNKQFNLTGVRDRDEAWRRLIIDSLTAIPFLEELPEDTRVIDVGSGGGLPGIPIAITRPDLHVTLLEATGKKAKFLQLCADQIPLTNVTVINDRAESIGQSKLHRQKYDVAICRAVGPLRELLEYTLPLVKLGGHVLAMKGPKFEEELGEASDAMAVLGGGEVQVFDSYPQEAGMRTVIVRIEKAQPTPQIYPRLPGLARQSPL